MNGKRRTGSNEPAPACILIVNVHSTMNAGDAALLFMNMQQLREGFRSPQFLISANYPDEAFLHQIPDARVVSSPFAVAGANQGAPVPLQILRLLFGAFLAVLLRWLPVQQSGRRSGRGGWLQFIQAYRQADLVVAVSGNQFLSMGKYGWPFPLTAFSVWMAHLYGRPFYVMPQSIGPFKRGWEKRVFKWLYSRARLVFLRDDVSLDLARELGLPEAKVKFAPDPAFALPAAGHEEAVHLLESYGYRPGQPAVGMTVIAPLARTINQAAVQQYYRDLASALGRFVKTFNVQVFIFNQVTGPTPRENDSLAGRQVLSLLDSTSRVVMVNKALTPAQLKACYGCMDLMIASRLHSGIFAMGAGVATLLIGYFTKSRGLLRAMGLEEWLVELGSADAEKILGKLNRIWEQRQALAEITRQKAGEYAAQVSQLGVQIREDFEHG